MFIVFFMFLGLLDAFESAKDEFIGFWEDFKSTPEALKRTRYILLNYVKFKDYFAREE